MPDPLVSVVIPVYNGERFLEAALRSVGAQTYGHLEVFVIDDGSSDGSRTIAQGFAQFNVIGGAHRGVSAARNLGVEQSRGEFIAFLDADDIWYPEKISAQVALAEAEPRWGLVTVLQDYLFEGPVPEWFRGPVDGGTEAGFMPSSWLLRRAWWDAVGPFDTTMTHAEDVDWLARARDHGLKSGTVEQLLLTRRIHDANASGVARESRAGLMTALRGSLQRKHAALP